LHSGQYGSENGFFFVVAAIVFKLPVKGALGSDLWPSEITLQTCG